MEKVRYFLEKSVPELKDLQDKGLFDKREIGLVMRRRTDFEYRISSRGCKPKDFARYIEFEKNLERLRVKRHQRFKKVNAVDPKKTISDYAGIKRINFLYDRAVDRFPDQEALWSSYLLFAKQNHSTAMIYNIYTKVLQKHPNNIKFWISAANYEFESNSNAKGARTLFQKALRFNSESLPLWLAYCEFELLYVTKLLERRRVLGLLDKNENTDNGDNADVLELPETETFAETLKQLPEADMDMLGTPESNPALRGDIALTIFDVALKTLVKDKKSESKHAILSESDVVLSVSRHFLTVFDKFHGLNRTYLVGHVINEALNLVDNNDITLWDITLPVRYDTVQSETFVDDLKLSVNKFLGYKAKGKVLTGPYVEYLKNHFMASDMSENIRKVLESIMKRLSQ